MNHLRARVSRRRRPVDRYCLALGLCVALTADCAGVAPPGWRSASADRRAREAGATRAQLEAGDFVLTAYRRHPDGPSDVLVVYIEGDGAAWSSRGRPSRDPTPITPVALDLALADPNRAVVYLARPCQYTTPSTRTGCRPAYWTDRRFSPEVVAAMSQAIDHEKREAGSAAIELVGFSGGGVLAALLAARRDDVRSLITLAAPLDLGAWVAHHELTPLDGSLDPAKEVSALVALPQVHLVGGRDAIVPPELVERYVRGFPPTAAIRVDVIPDADHRCCWTRSWRERAASLRAWLRR